MRGRQLAGEVQEVKISSVALEELYNDPDVIEVNPGQRLSNTAFWINDTEIIENFLFSAGMNCQDGSHFP